VRSGVARLPDDVSGHHIVGVAAVAGVGFTVSLFIAGLAFTGGLLEDDKAGVFAASLLAPVLGAALLARAARRGRVGGAHRNPNS
jgi:NhaA family Na+:H+ antiporter